MPACLLSHRVPAPAPPSCGRQAESRHCLLGPHPHSALQRDKCTLEQPPRPHFLEVWHKDPWGSETLCWNSQDPPFPAPCLGLPLLTAFHQEDQSQQVHIEQIQGSRPQTSKRFAQTENKVTLVTDFFLLT